MTRNNQINILKSSSLLHGFMIIAFVLGTVTSSMGAIMQDTSCVGQNGAVKWYYYNNIEGVWLEDLYGHPYFPQVPDGYLELFSLQSPYKFNERFGSMISGFIKPPVTGTYQFNVTGDNQTRFLLSDGTDPENLGNIAETGWSAWIDDHGPDSLDRTSDTIHLIADRYYYFELHHKENTGTDHAQVYWKTPFYPDTLWTLVHGAYLYDNLCFETCEPVGTPCDDGDSLTVNDIQDGFCNCYGSPATNNPCIGQKGEVVAMYYDSISGNPLSNLYEADHYPLSPTEPMFKCHIHSQKSGKYVRHSH